MKFYMATVSFTVVSKEPLDALYGLDPYDYETVSAIVNDGDIWTEAAIVSRHKTLTRDEAIALTGDDRLIEWWESENETE